MIRPFEKAVSYFLLLLTLTVSAVAVQAQQGDDSLVVALQEARNAGVPETSINRLLALGYEKQVEPSAMGNLLTILTQCQQEKLPLQPFLSKIEEGFAKRVPASRIEQVLQNKLSDYRFTRSLIEGLVKGHGEADSISPEYLVRLTETLSCGVSREDLDRLLNEFPDAPLPILTRGAETLASLRQIRFDPKMSEQIVDTGVTQGYFTAERRDFARSIVAARNKGLQDDQIVRAALEVIEKGGSQADFLSQLEISAQDVDRQGPQVGKSSPGPGGLKSEESGGRLGKGHGAAPSRGGDQPGSGSTRGSDSGSSSGGASGSTPGGSNGSGGGSGNSPGDGSSSSSETKTTTAHAEAKQPPTKKTIRFNAAGVVANIKPADLTMKLDIEKANSVLKGRIGKAVTFVISENVKVKSEGSEPGVFDLDLNDIKAKESHVRVLGKKLAGRTYLITHIVVAPDEAGLKQKKKSARFTASGIAANVDPTIMTITLDLEKASGDLEEYVGEGVTFAVSEHVNIETEGSAASLFGQSLIDVRADEDYVSVFGKKLAGGDYVITHIIIVSEE